MAELRQFEFCLLRYVPNVVRGEFVNIGVLLFEPQPNGFGFAEVRMTSDWRRATCLDRQIDIEILQALEADVRLRLRQPEDVGSLLHKLEDSFANLIQISSRQTCLAAEPVQELETLSSLYLEGPQTDALPATNRPRSERALILTQIKDAFTRAGIWSLLTTQIKAADYTKKKGDPLVFDFGFQVGTEVRFFQSVPLKTGIHQAVILASRFPKIAECIFQKNQNAQLTAVVADDLDRTRPEIDFALDAFKENHVYVASASDMTSIADKVRLDLNAWGRAQ
jgi:Protein of unknown function (DUF3037)